MVVKKKVGRPSNYTPALASLICARIAGGESLRAICRDADMPERTTVHLWLLEESKKQFFNQYEQSCNIRAENMFDELNEIADDGTNDWMERENKDGTSYTVLNGEAVARSRLRVDTRKWYLSKVLPKKFGEKLDMTTNGKELPAPIMKLDALRRNDSDQEDNQTD